MQEDRFQQLKNSNLTFESSKYRKHNLLVCIKLSVDQNNLILSIEEKYLPKNWQWAPKCENIFVLRYVIPLRAI